MKKYKRKINVVVMDPVQCHRESLVYVLREFMFDRINITDVVPCLSEIMRLSTLKGAADVYIMEAYGQNENYKYWSDFTHFMATYFPSAMCLVWSSKPTMFLKKLNAFEGINTCWQIPKRTDIDHFVRFLTQIIDGDNFTPPHSHSCIGPRISNLTLREIDIITGIIEGNSIRSLSQKYDIAYKTASTHKRNAMMKMCISSTSQLRSLFMDCKSIRYDVSPVLLNKSYF